MLTDETSLFMRDSLSSLSTYDEWMDSLEPNFNIEAFAVGFFFLFKLDSPLSTLETMTSEPISDERFFS
jgi:hypothetical protein